MNSYFITGTDTDIGKTWVTAGLVASIKKMGIDVGIMKPFAAGDAQKSGYKSEDVQLLANAAQVNDPEELVNPYFFELPASPFAATQNLGLEFDVKIVMDCFNKLSAMHDVLLVEGMGGIMTPILQNYFVSNLIKEMNLKTIIVTSSKIGTVNHTIMTYQICKKYGLDVSGFIINNLDSNGYPVNELKRDIEKLTDTTVLGSIPYIDDFNLEIISEIVTRELDLKSLVS